MDIIYITGLKIDTIIGIHDWERDIRQTVVVDLELGVDVNRAALADWIGYALDYSKVHDRVISFVQESDAKLLETLAEKLARIIMREFGVPWLQLRIGKPGALPGDIDVGVVIERGEAL
jgi:dihydroneopterin aldolase